MVARRIAPKYAASIEQLVNHAGLRLSEVPFNAAEGEHDGHSPCHFVCGPPEMINAMYVRQSKKEHGRALQGTPVEERRSTLVTKQLRRKLTECAQKGLCVYCWLPESACFCRDIAKAFSAEGCTPDAKGPGSCYSFKNALLGGDHMTTLPVDFDDAMHSDFYRHIKKVSSFLEVAVIVHADEFLRQSNTGHVLAMLLDAPVLLWGFPLHDAQLAAWGVENERAGVAGNASPQISPASAATTTTYLLYPSEDAAHVDSVTFAHVRSALEERLTAARAARGASAAAAQRKEGATAQTAAPLIRLVLSDGTWGEAGSVNRKVMRAIPRLRLTIDEAYESLFWPLRSQTRKTGVSTMEATALAIKALMAKVECEAAAFPQDAVECVSSCLQDVMKQFVDVQVVQKGKLPVYHRERYEELQEAIGAGKHAVHRSIMALKREGLGDDEALRRQMWSPVLHFCIPCGRFVGALRMPDHVAGVAHQAAVAGRPLSAAWDAPLFSNVTGRMKRCTESPSHSSDDEDAAAKDSH